MLLLAILLLLNVDEYTVYQKKMSKNAKGSLSLIGYELPQ